MRPRVAALMGAPLLVLALSGAAPAGAAEPPPAVPVLQPLLDAWRQLRVWAGDVLPLADREGRFGPLVDSNARQAAAAQRVAGPVGMLAGRDDLRAAQARAAAARRHAQAAMNARDQLERRVGWSGTQAQFQARLARARALATAAGEAATQAENAVITLRRARARNAVDQAMWQVEHYHRAVIGLSAAASEALTRAEAEPNLDRRTPLWVLASGNGLAIPDALNKLEAAVVTLAEAGRSDVLAGDPEVAALLTRATTLREEARTAAERGIPAGRAGRQSSRLAEELDRMRGLRGEALRAAQAARQRYDEGDAPGLVGAADEARAARRKMVVLDHWVISKWATEQGIPDDHPILTEIRAAAALPPGDTPDDLAPIEAEARTALEQGIPLRPATTPATTPAPANAPAPAPAPATAPAPAAAPVADGTPVPSAQVAASSADAPAYVPTAPPVVPAPPPLAGRSAVAPVPPVVPPVVPPGTEVEHPAPVSPDDDGAVAMMATDPRQPALVPGWLTGAPAPVPAASSPLQVSPGPFVLGGTGGTGLGGGFPGMGGPAGEPLESLLDLKGG